MQVRVKALLAFKEITIKTVAVKQLFMLKLQQCNVKKQTIKVLLIFQFFPLCSCSTLHSFLKKYSLILNREFNRAFNGVIIKGSYTIGPSKH